MFYNPEFFVKQTKGLSMLVFLPSRDNLVTYYRCTSLKILNLAQRHFTPKFDIFIFKLTKFIAVTERCICYIRDISAIISNDCVHYLILVSISCPMLNRVPNAIFILDYLKFGALVGFSFHQLVPPKRQCVGRGWMICHFLII